MLDALRDILVIVNSVFTGRVVDVDPSVTYALLDSMSGQISNDGFSASMIDSDNQYAYPILGLSYFIIETVNATNCDATVELIRYISWTQSDPYAVALCRKLKLTTMPTELTSLMTTDILMNITCDKGVNAYSLLQKQVSHIAIEADFDFYEKPSQQQYQCVYS